MARPTKCTPEVRERVVAGILANFPQDVAAARAGIGERTHYDYMARGQAALERAESDDPDDADENDRPFAQYSQAVEEARREWEGRQLAIIARGAAGTPAHRQNPDTQEWENNPQAVKRETVKLDAEGHEIERTTIYERIPGNTGDAKWMLERRLSQRYGRVWRAELVTPEGETVEVGLDDLARGLLGKVDELAERRKRRIDHEARQAQRAEGNGQGDK